MSSILIIEDDCRMNEIIKDYFEMAGHQVFASFDGVDGLQLFEKEAIDLVILDIMMPKLDGWSVCRRIRQKSDCLIILLSARSEEDDKLMGFELGADEYVTKPFSPKVLVASATALIKRHQTKQLPEKILHIGPLSINKEAYLILADSTPLALTAKEYELLLLFAENPGRVYKREVLIDAIWGYDYFGDGRVVDTNIKTLRKKLGAHAHLIQTVIGIGYKLEVK